MSFHSTSPSLAADWTQRLANDGSLTNRTTWNGGEYFNQCITRVDGKLQVVIGVQREADRRAMVEPDNAVYEHALTLLVDQVWIGCGEYP